MSDFKLVFTPLGGLGQIGSNMILLESTQERILLDCGILFPDDSPYEIDYIIPDYRDIPTPTDVIITHGHEDHIGGIFQLLKTFPNIRIHAPLFAKYLIQKKFSKKIKLPEIIEYDNKDEIKFRDFKLNPLKVDHSIPDTYGVLLRSNDRKLCLFYVSDFKIDVHESQFDLDWLKKASKDYQKKYLFADSTNILSYNLKTPPESCLINEMDIFFKSKSRLFITFFASNSFRLKTILELSKKYNRKVVAYGASMNSYIEVAKDCDIIDKKIGIHDVEEVDPKDPNLVILVSGCQGDFKSAVRRVSSGEDKYFKLNELDTFIFSSKTIPGNEKKISRIFNSLIESNIRLVTDVDHPVHVSGHAGKEDLKILYDNFTPTHFIPIHGESYFLKRHQQYFNSLYENTKSFFLTNNDSIELMGEKITRRESPEAIFIHGNDIVLEKEKIKERRKVAQRGLILVSLNKMDKKFQLDLVGIPEKVSQKDLENVVKNWINKNLKGKGDDLKVSLRKKVNNIIGYKPEVILHIL